MKIATERNVSPSTVMLTEAKARLLVAKINENVNQAGIWLLEYRDLEGWKAQGYGSFTEACKKEFKDIIGGRSQVYRLMQQAEISEEVGEPVAPKTSLALAKAPPEKRKEALELAKEASGQDKPPVAAVEAAVSKVTEPAASVPLRGTSSGSRSTSAPKKSAAYSGPSPSSMKEPSVKLDAALERIGKIIGPAAAKNIGNGTLNNVTPHGAVYWASLSDDDMRAIQDLVVAKRWDPKRAFKFISRMPDEKTKIADLIVLATAAGGFVTVTTGGFCTVTLNTRKLPDEWARIKKTLGIK